MRDKFVLFIAERSVYYSVITRIAVAIVCVILAFTDLPEESIIHLVRAIKHLLI